MGLATLRPPLALAPPTEISIFGLQSLDNIQSIEELEQLRDRFVILD